MVRSISDAVVAKDGEPFFLCPPDGQIPCRSGHGYGLYRHDCRFLSGYELCLAGTAPNSLVAAEADGTRLVLELTNAEIIVDGGRASIAKEQLGITWHRQVEGGTPALEDTIELRNYGQDAVDLPLELRFAASFEDVFEVRGLVRPKRGELDRPAWDGDRLQFDYHGTDGVDRSLHVSFDPQPARRRGPWAEFDLHAGLRGTTSVRVTARLDERLRPGAKPIEGRSSAAVASQTTGAHRRELDPSWLVGGPGWMAVRTSSLALQAALDRSFRDLQLLTSRLGGDRYYEAGIPWFATLFGRDALIAALQTIPFDATVQGDTLRLLARRRDKWRDELPGKILHELRIGHPQAWAAGSIPALLISALGLIPESLERRLRISRPRLPAFVQSVELRDLAVGDARVDLDFERQAGATIVRIAGVQGDMDVRVEDAVEERVRGVD